MIDFQMKCFEIKPMQNSCEVICVKALFSGALELNFLDWWKLSVNTSDKLTAFTVNFGI